MKQISFRRMTSKSCAVCHNKTHPGFMSAAAVREHQCCEKECPYLQKLEHDYWKQREGKKLENRTMKLLGRQYITWTKNGCYKQVKMMSIDDLRDFVVAFEC